MVLRYVRLCMVTGFSLTVVYLIFVFQRDEVDLPAWAGAIKHADWTHIDWTQPWPSYSLDLLLQDLHDLKDSKWDRPRPEEPVACVPTNSTNETAISPVQEKPPLPQLDSHESPYAYIFPVSTDEQACATIINIHLLTTEFHTRHRIFVLLQNGISVSYMDAMRSLNVTISWDEPPHPQDTNAADYGHLFMLRAFDLHRKDRSVKRVLALDANQVILRSIDSVFDLPAVDLAAPRTYWADPFSISPSFLLINLSDRLWEKLETTIHEAPPQSSSSELLSRMFKHTSMLLPGSYAAQLLHWKEWKMPEWFRPEEIWEMDEARRTTPPQTDPPRKVSALVAALGGAINKWKSDFDMSESGGEDAQERAPERAQGTNLDNLEETTNDPEPLNDRATLNIRRQIYGSEHNHIKGLLRYARSDDGDKGAGKEREGEEVTSGEAETMTATESETQSRPPEPAKSALEDPKPQAPPLKPNPEIPSTVTDRTKLEQPLHDLYRVVHVLQFAKGEEPWLKKMKEVALGSANLHSKWVEHHHSWRKLANSICPPVNRTFASNQGDVWKAERLVEEV